MNLYQGQAKENVNNEYAIIIEKAYFYYVLIKKMKKNGKIEDEETKRECDENKIQYIGFDINSIDKKDNCSNSLF